MIFFKRSRNTSTPITEKRIAQKQYLISMTGRHDYEQLFRCDAAIKVWFPSSTARMLREISQFQNITVADFIRQVLFINQYGRYDFLGYVERDLHNFCDPDEVMDTALFSLATDDDNGKGLLSGFLKKAESSNKNPPKKTSPPQEVKDVSLRIPIPAKMKNDLVAMAEKDYLPVSEFVRRVITVHLLGQQAAFESPPAGMQEGVE